MDPAFKLALEIPKPSQSETTCNDVANGDEKNFVRAYPDVDFATARVQLGFVNNPVGKL